MNPVIVEWLMGHDIGIAKHYLADNIKQEYSKFESAVRIPRLFLFFNEFHYFLEQRRYDVHAASILIVRSNNFFY